MKPWLMRAAIGVLAVALWLPGADPVPAPTPAEAGVGPRAHPA